MSSILEALKKLEEEKAARRSGTGNLTGKVAKAGRRHRQTPAWLIPGGMLIVAVVSILITYGTMRGFTPHRSENVPSQTGRDASPTPETRLPSAGVPVTDPLTHPQTGGGQTHPQAEGNAGKLPGDATRKSSPPPAAPAQPQAAAPAAPEQKQAGSAGASPPTLTVSGIAWQKDNTFRMAVVNGVPVREGGKVEGTTVVEILPDRVRFSINGREFEAALEQ